MMEDASTLDMPLGAEAITADSLPPHLLNRINKDLTSQIAHYESESERIAREIEDHQNRLKFMVEHLANVKAEIINTQQLHEAKRREIETEDHLAQLAERERGRLVQRILQMKTETQLIRDKIDGLQNRIFQGTLRMDEFKAAMNFNQEELEQWDLARRQKEDDGIVLEKYNKQDDKKMKVLNLQVEKMSKAVQQKRLELEEEITETRSAQIELDKTSEDYKAMHQQRQYLLEQWEEAVKAMHRRDKAIESTEKQYGKVKFFLEQQQQQLKSRVEFLQVENENNRDVEGKIAQEERVLSKYREDSTILAKQLQELQDEVEVVRNTYAKAVKENKDLQVELQEAGNTKEKMLAHFAQIDKKHAKVVDQLEEAIRSANDLELQHKVVADLVLETERSMKALDKETTRIKDEQYKNSQELFTVRRQQASYLAEISGAQAQGKNMAAKIKQLDQESFKQQELLYSIEFNVQQMERKVNRAKGERTEEEKRELQEQIETLQKMLDDLLKQHKVLDVQVTRVNDDLRQAKKEAVKLEHEKKRVTDERLELTLENESANIELVKMTKEKEEALVNGDVLKLQVEAMKRTLSKRGEELLGLENRKQQLQLTIEERELEIKVHHDVLKMEAKTAEEERKAVVVELKERLQQVAHLKNRYEVLMGRMDKSAGETTQAQHVVQTAKEKEELQATGDALDSEIKRVERESKKLDKTIAILKGANNKFKHQFTKVGETDEEVLQAKVLQKKQKALQSVLNRRTNDMKEYMRSEMSAIGELQERQREKDATAQKIDILRDGEAGLLKDLEEQRELVAKYDTAIAKQARVVEPEISQDIQLIEETEKVEHVIGMLLQVASNRGEEVRRVAEGTLTRHEIEIPATAAGGAMPGVTPGQDVDAGEDDM